MDATTSPPYGTFPPAGPPAPSPALWGGPAVPGPRPRPGARLLLLLLAMTLACGFIVHPATEHAAAPDGVARLSSSTVESEGTSPALHQYGVMLDLGSSGSRLLVFRWCPGTPLQSIVELGARDTEPGVSWYYTKAAKANRLPEVPTLAGNSLLPLVEYAKTVVPAAAVPQTTIHARCTAGCRLLDAAAVRLVLEGVRSALGQSGFRFQPEYATEMSGEMEAILDWVSINAALGLLHQPKPHERHVRPTVGVLDVGGVSAQISYSIPEPAPVKHKPHHVAPDVAASPVVRVLGHGRFHLQLGPGVEHAIYAVSRMHYGLHDAQLLVVSHDVDPAARPGPEASGPPQRDVSLQPVGAPGPRLALAARPQPPAVRRHPCVQKGAFFVTRAGHNVTGTGDAKACLRAAERFFHQAKDKDLADVKWALPNPPRTSPMPFVALDNFFKLSRLAAHVLHKRQTMDVSVRPVPPSVDRSASPHGSYTWGHLAQCMADFPTVDAEMLMAAAEVACPLDVTQLQRRVSDEEAELLEDSCYGLVHMRVLLSKVYDFAKKHVHPMATAWRCPGRLLPDASPPGATPTEEVRGTARAVYSSSWALGGMVLAIEAERIGPAR
eukprot:EG_transcript_5233